MSHTLLSMATTGRDCETIRQNCAASLFAIVHHGGVTTRLCQQKPFAKSHQGVAMIIAAHSCCELEVEAVPQHASFCSQERELILM